MLCCWLGEGFFVFPVEFFGQLSWLAFWGTLSGKVFCVVSSGGVEGVIVGWVDGGSWPVCCVRDAWEK